MRSHCQNHQDYQKSPKLSKAIKSHQRLSKLYISLQKTAKVLFLHFKMTSLVLTSSYYIGYKFADFLFRLLIVRKSSKGTKVNFLSVLSMRVKKSKALSCKACRGILNFLRMHFYTFRKIYDTVGSQTKNLSTFFTPRFWRFGILLTSQNKKLFFQYTPSLNDVN